MKKINWKWIVSIVAIAIVISIFIYNNMRSAVKVKIAKAAVADILPTVSVSGEIKGTDAKLSPKIPGVISWIGVKEGDEVAKGQIIVKFDNFENSKSDYFRIKKLYQDGFAAKQQFEAAKLQYENSYLASPLRGIVSHVANRVGETAGLSGSVISIIDPSSAYAELQIDESDIGLVKTGNEVQIESDAYPDDIFKGKLVNIGQQAELKKIGGYIKADEEDRIIRGKAVFNDKSYKLKIGMTISADIIVEKKKNVLSIPRDAVFAKDSASFVFVVKGKDGFWGRQYVKEVKADLGLKDSYYVEIKKGLAAGDEVAVANVDKLKDKSKVIIEK